MIRINQTSSEKREKKGEEMMFSNKKIENVLKPKDIILKIAMAQQVSNTYIQITRHLLYSFTASSFCFFYSLKLQTSLKVLVISMSVQCES